MQRRGVVRRSARMAGIVLVQVVVVLILLEGVGRLFNPLGISYYPETSRYLDTMILEEPIGYRMRPGLQKTFHGVPVVINSLGMRDREVSADPDGEFRILVLGDSLVFGIGVRQEDSIPSQLERILNSDRPGPLPYRTLNMGVISYNTEQEAIQLETLGNKLRPRLAILYFVDNDIEPKMWTFNKRNVWYRNLAQRSYAASLLLHLYRESRSRVYEAIGRSTTTLYVSVGEYRASSPRWQAIDRSLTRIQALLRPRGVPFVLFTGEKEGSAALTLLRGVGTREGFPVVTLTLSEDPRWKNEDPRRFRNSPVDGHPNAVGCRALATLIAENLRRLGVLQTP